MSRLTSKHIENLRLGTIRAREILPPGSGHITDKQIQEALWHYYYDVERSVAYLRKEYMTKPKEQKKIVTGGFRLYLQLYMPGSSVR